MASLARQKQAWNKRLAKEHRFDRLPNLKEICRLGVPAERRAPAWWALSGAQDLYRADPHGFATNLQKARSGGGAGGAVAQIEKDLDRTFPSHPFFETDAGISALRDVLTAFAVRRPDIGYCQSMNFIVGILLLFYPKELDKCYWMLVAIVEIVLPPDYYTPSMSGIHVDIMVLQRLLDRKLPAVSAHLKANHIELEIVAISWFLCLFLNSLPIETTLRVWDALFLEKSKILFRIALAIFKLNEAAILGGDDEQGGMYARIKNTPKSAYDADRLLEAAFSVESIGKADIQAHRDECRVIVSAKLAKIQQARENYRKEK